MSHYQPLYHHDHFNVSRYSTVLHGISLYEPHSHLLPLLANTFLFMSQQLLVGQGLLIIEASRSHWDTAHSVGLLWTSDQPDAETITWQHTTLTRDRLSCPRRDSNSQSYQTSGRRPTPETARPLGWTSRNCLLRRAELCILTGAGHCEQWSAQRTHKFDVLWHLIKSDFLFRVAA
jgi:hypothetical protein